MNRQRRDKLAVDVRTRRIKQYAAGREGRDALRADVDALLEALFHAEADADALYIALLKMNAPPGSPVSAPEQGARGSGGPALGGGGLSAADRESGAPISASGGPAPTGQVGVLELGPPALDRPGGLEEAALWYAKTKVLAEKSADARPSFETARADLYARGARAFGEEARLRGGLARVKAMVEAIADDRGVTNTFNSVVTAIEGILSAPRVAAVPETFLPPVADRPGGVVMLGSGRGYQQCTSERPGHPGVRCRFQAGHARPHSTGLGEIEWP